MSARIKFERPEDPGTLEKRAKGKLAGKFGEGYYESWEDEEKSKIMSYEEYAKRRHETPYVFELKSGEKEIVYFGARHSNNPADKMFDDMEKKFKEAKPEMVLVEGIRQLATHKAKMAERLKKMSRDEAIEKTTEVGFAAKLAFENGVDVESPEPTYEDEINHLLGQGFSKDDIFALYLYRQALQYQRMTKNMKEKQKIEEYLAPYIKYFKESSNWRDFDYSLNHLKEIGQKIWGPEDGQLEAKMFSAERVDPTPRRFRKLIWTQINEIAQNSSCFRDRFMVDRISELIKEKNKIFIVFGASHAYMQEPALRELLNK